MIMLLGIGCDSPKSIVETEPYKMLIESISNNRLIKIETGGIKSFAEDATGSVHEKDGVGQANICVKVEGNKKDMVFCADFLKEKDAAWKLMGLKEKDKELDSYIPNLEEKQ